jgi:hypothetical protein
MGGSHEVGAALSGAGAELPDDRSTGALPVRLFVGLTLSL